jgi:hypothetical protein
MATFLHESRSQLTVPGIFKLTETMCVGELAVFFRNNHFNTLYKHSDGKLYILVTDQGYQCEHAVAWERLDNEHGDTTFVTAEFEAYADHERRHRIEQEELLQQIYLAEQVCPPNNFLACTLHSFNGRGSAWRSVLMLSGSQTWRRSQQFRMYTRLSSKGEMLSKRVSMQIETDDAAAPRSAADIEGLQAALQRPASQNHPISMQNNTHASTPSGSVAETDHEMALRLHNEANLASQLSRVAESDHDMALRLQQEEREAVAREEKRGARRMANPAERQGHGSQGASDRHSVAAQPRQGGQSERGVEGPGRGGQGQQHGGVASRKSRAGRQPSKSSDSQCSMM